MMAYDSRSTPDRPRLSEETLTELRGAVRALWQAPHAVDVPLEAAMGALVREARDRALRAEDVLLEVKALLTAMPELEAPERRLEGTRFREQLITRCIKAYYHSA
jgi:hypothetical protein